VVVVEGFVVEGVLLFEEVGGGVRECVELVLLVPDMGELVLDVVVEVDFVVVGIRPVDEFVVVVPFEFGDVVGR
jgi:hypothetical protein